MGVQGLWSLMGQCSKAILLETLSNKIVAVDASIWLYQFMMAMRDKSGTTLDGAHLIGFLRRILKLLFYGIKPVFVYDGAVPELKKNTVKKRRERRQMASNQLEKTAQKILENRMKMHALAGGDAVGDAVNVETPLDTNPPDEYQLPKETKRFAHISPLLTKHT